MAQIIPPISAVDAVVRRIDEWHEYNTEKPRSHFGISVIGDNCSRRLWLNFRWCGLEVFSGRMLRLFRRGHLEETVIVQDLRNIGCVIHNTDAEEDGQVRVDFGSHVSGSVDGIIESGVPRAEKTRHILECKTYSAKSFASLCRDGVQRTKPRHYVQMQCYMLGTGIERALYCAVNKDNDEMYVERVPLDKNFAEMKIARAKKIALADRLPEPLSADGTFYECKFCSHCNFCHSTHLCTDVNCRNCAHVTPTEDSTWRCELFNKILTYDEQLKGCHEHKAHPDLVPWRFVGWQDECAVYAFGGEEFLNGNPLRNEDAHTTAQLIKIYQETSER